MKFNKIMAFCWLYILGIIAATAFSVNITYVNMIYGTSGIFILIGIILHIIQRKNLTISDSTVMTFFLIGSFLLGYARYTHHHNFSDPNHISQFASEGFERNAPVYQIIGKISGDPDVFYDKTKVTIEPYLIKKMKVENKYKKVAGGDFVVQIKRKAKTGDSVNPIWTEFSVPEVYGKIVRVTGKLVAPRDKSDPYGYDAREQANASNVYAMMFNPDRMTILDESLLFDEQEKKTYKENEEKYNPLYLLTKFSLSVKRKMLTTFKLTMPYPESAFLSGITLGLKRGLQNMPTILNDYYKYFEESLIKDDPKILNDFLSQYDATKDKNSQLITVQFQWSGVGHVLAVSGLHVTIITIFLFGIFSALKIHRKVFAPILVLGLVIFCIITGAAPSSTRATLMNSIAVLTLVYSSRGLRASAIFSIGAAGFLILLKSPLVIYSPSFSLSFGAVLALVLLTKPVDMQLIKLRGLVFIWGILIFIGFFLIVIYDWFLFVNPYFYLPAVAVIFIVGKLLKKLDEQYPVIGSIGYQSIPNNFRQFLSAQFAIQIGMMIPLSAWYFTKFPVAGMLANFIAIPLVGINVQLGIFSGILGMIPKIGVWIALVLNATNWG
ncbi:ComEC/Rec2 family competence protein, partial [Candidatus Dependentiae bacterium]|nr:ComEC/Rec2 family competence protein [Candidatus Dependentiae bacterium]